MTTEEVDEIAQGRVWSGQDAYDLGLVDHLGGLNDAIAAAAELAELGDDYEISYIEKEEKFKDKILREMMTQAMAAAGPEIAPASPLEEMLHGIERAAAEITVLNDPYHAYAWSNIETD